MHYTPAQTRWFLAAADDLALDAHRTDVIGQRAAQAEPKALRAYLGGPAAATAHPARRKKTEG